MIKYSVFVTLAAFGMSTASFGQDQRVSIVGLLAMILVGFVVLLFRNYQNKKNVNLQLDRKLDERTRTFKQSYLEWMKSVEEERSQRERIFQHLVTNIARIRSLCSIAMPEVLDPVAIRYLTMINSSAERMHRCTPEFQEKELK